MRKKGILLPNIVTGIIAILALSAIAYFIWRGVTAIQSNEEQKNAQYTINFIKAKVDALEIGAKTTQNIQLFKSDGYWFISGWDKRNLDRPEKCFFDNCICLCKSNTPYIFVSYADSSIRSMYEREGYYVDKSFCQDNSYCRPIDADIVNVATVTLPQEGAVIKIEFEKKIDSEKKKEIIIRQAYQNQITT